MQFQRKFHFLSTRVPAKIFRKILAGVSRGISSKNRILSRNSFETLVGIPSKVPTDFTYYNALRITPRISAAIVPLMLTWEIFQGAPSEVLRALLHKYFLCFIQTFILILQQYFPRFSLEPLQKLLQNLLSCISWFFFSSNSRKDTCLRFSTSLRNLFGDSKIYIPFEISSVILTRLSPIFLNFCKIFLRNSSGFISEFLQCAQELHKKFF